MKRPRLLLVVGCAAMTVALAAGQDPAPSQLTFRSGIEGIQLDVSVLDKDRTPVRGLTAADFTVLEDGKPRAIRTFEAVEVPPRVTPPAAWMRDVAPDVVTNAPLKGRVLAIVIDDGSLRQNGGQWGVKKTRAIAKAAIDEMGPEDLATVVFTMYNHSAQGFTRDRARLLQALDDASVLPRCSATGGMGACDFNQTGWCTCGECSVEALERISSALLSFPERRKTLLYISTGVGLADGTAGQLEVGVPAAFSGVGPACDQRRTEWVIKALRQAALANVTVQAIDPNGLCGSDCQSFPETLKAIAESTGGRAVVQNNDADREVPALFEESSAYYMLGVETSVMKDDGRFHPIQVRVNRPDVTVETRRGYVAPTAKERAAMTAAADSHTPDGSITGAAPKHDVPLAVTAAAFATPNKTAAVMLVLDVHQPVDAAVAGRTDAGRVDVLTSAFGEENGTFYGSRRQTLNVVVRPGATELPYEVLSRMPMKTGRYEFRLGIKTADGRTASVYTYADVPDFASSPLSLSGLVVAASGSPVAAPRDAFADVIPVVPTARRAFASSDRASGFVRIYQGGNGAAVPVTIRAKVVDATDRDVWTATTHLDPAAFGKARSADYAQDLPLSRLGPGEYLLRITADAGKRSDSRAIRFSVQ